MTFPAFHYDIIEVGNKKSSNLNPSESKAPHLSISSHLKGFQGFKIDFIFGFIYNKYLIYMYVCIYIIDFHEEL